MNTRVPRAGPVLVPARFPARAPIESYGNSGFRFAGMSHKGSILALPDGIEAWDAVTAEDIDISTLSRVIEQAASIQVALIGTGATQVPIDADLRTVLSQRGLYPEMMSTGAAVRTYNVLLSEGRAVAAALIAVENAGRAGG